MNENKKRYNKEYDKNNYKQKTIRYKLNLYRKIEDYCTFNGMSINEFTNSAAKYIIDEKVDLNGYK